MATTARRLVDPRWWRGATGLLFAAVVLSLALRPAAPSTNQAAGITEAPGYGKLPLAFEPSRGRTEADFIARSTAGTVLISSSGAQLSLGREADASRIDLRVIGGAQREPAALERLPGVVNDLRGDDATRWETHIPTFERVRYREVYPGVDLEWHGSQQRLEYDFRVAPGADPGEIALRVAGAHRVRLARNGDLVLSAGGEAIRQSAPVAYQGEGTSRTPVAVRFKLRGNTVSLALGAYDRSRPLVIDPVVLNYSTYLGGNGAERANAIAVDSGGAAYLTGRTLSTDFNKVGGIESVTGQGDVFVSKLNAAGNAVIYSTYIGGDGEDSGNGIAIDGTGVYIVGTTKSTDFNTVNAKPNPDPGLTNRDAGIADAFVAKLKPAGDGLIYSTYLGGGGDLGDGGSNSGFVTPPFEKKAGAPDEGVAIAIDSSGAAYVTGSTNAASVPGTSATHGFPLKGQIEGDTSEKQPQGGCASGICQDSPSTMTSDAFVTKLTPAGNDLVYSTFLGGDLGDGATAIAVDSAGAAYVAGATNSPDFNVVEGHKIEGHNGSYEEDGRITNFDAFVSKINPLGNALVYSTYLGGSDFDAASGIAIDSAGAAYVTGTTDSSDFDRVHAIEGDSNGPDAFVSKLNPAGSALMYSSYLGGGLADAANSIAVDSAGRALITGTTSSTDFDRSGQIEGDAGLEDAFVSSLTPGGDLACSTYLGGEGSDSGNAIALGPSGAAYVAGSTDSTDFNTAGPLEGNSGGPDAFASKLSLTQPCERHKSEAPDGLADDLQVYVVVLDGLRPQEIDLARTPFLNGLKESGTWYEQARAVFLAETLPNHAAMMTGVQPQRSGLLGNDYWERNDETARDPAMSYGTKGGYNHRMLDPTKLDVETLPTTLEEGCDISSATVMSKGYLWYLFGGEPPNPDDPAWQRRADYVWGAPESDAYIPDPDDHTPDASVMADGFMPWLQSAPPSPRFAFLNLGDVDRSGHIDESGATAPGGTLTAFRQAALSDQDAQVRMFVNELQSGEDPDWDHSVLIFTSDHGMDWSTPDHQTGGTNSIYDNVPGITTTNDVVEMPAVARAVSGGGTTMFYLQRGATPKQAKDVADAVKSVQGIETVVTRTPLAGYPTLDDIGMNHPDAGDIIGLNKPGWRDGGFHGSSGNPIPGNHGHPVTQHSVLFVTGGHPALDEKPESVEGPVVYDPSHGIFFSTPEKGPGNLSVAPTVSRLFGLQGPEGGYDRGPLSAAFDDWALKPHSPCEVSDLPVLATTDVRITEGDSGTSAAKVVVTLSKAGEKKVRVDYETVEGSAKSPSDYESQGPATLTFDPGQTKKTISIPVKGDVQEEPDETFRVRLSGQSHAELGDHEATVTIVNDDGDDQSGGRQPGGSRRVSRCAGLRATITGTARSDRRKRRLVGTSRRDVIAALGGKDRADGRGRADSICGGRGADSLRGGRGKDRVLGGAGRDSLYGGKRKDKLIGGRGKDRIYALGGSTDRIRCGRGFDVVHAGFRDKVARSCERVRRS